MCLICHHIFCQCKKQKIKKRILDWLGVDLADNYLDFLYIQSILQDALGIKVSKTDVFKHCLVIATQHYENKNGINTLGNINAQPS